LNVHLFDLGNPPPVRVQECSVPGLLIIHPFKKEG